MPIYEYRCTNCGEHVEILQRIHDRPLRTCKTCSGRMEKLISRTAFLLKGGGWYAEGYQRSAEKPEAATGDKSKAEAPKKEKSAEKKKKADAKGSAKKASTG